MSSSVMVNIVCEEIGVNIPIPIPLDIWKAISKDADNRGISTEENIHRIVMDKARKEAA